MSFRLHKWYLDCVGPFGEAAIVYSAQLRWGLLNLGYSAVIHAEPGGEPVQAQSWRSSSPIVEDRALLWKNPSLSAEGSWADLAPGPEFQLHEGIRWRCHQPGGPARLRLPSGKKLSGFGYAEELVLELPPWRLPFRELRWGRFIPDEGSKSLAWIQWRERTERGWCFRNGRETVLEECSGDLVRFPGGRLDLLQSSKLREGFLLREILGAGAFLCPGPLRRAHESKQLARGKLMDESGSREGWVIHECVRLR